VSQTSDTDSKVVININETNCRLGSGSGKNANFSIFFMNPASTTLTKTCSWDGNLVSSNNKQGMVRGSGSATGFATAINGLRLLLSSGTIASGNFRLFGLK
jgi:hypothetical protein